MVQKLDSADVYIYLFIYLFIWYVRQVNTAHAHYSLGPGSSLYALNLGEDNSTVLD